MKVDHVDSFCTQKWTGKVSRADRPTTDRGGRLLSVHMSREATRLSADTGRPHGEVSRRQAHRAH